MRDDGRVLDSTYIATSRLDVTKVGQRGIRRYPRTNQELLLLADSWIEASSVPTPPPSEVVSLESQKLARPVALAGCSLSVL